MIVKHSWSRWLAMGSLLLLLAALWGNWASAQSAGSTATYLPAVFYQVTPTPTPRPNPPGGSVIPNDRDYGGYQWGLQQIQAPAGWSISTGREVTIAVLDSGVDYSHPDLADKMVAPGLWRNFVTGGTDPMDRYGHGTHVAGIAAATSNNGRGIAGTSWGARILPIKVLGDNGSGYMSDVALGIQYATNSGAKVINLSLGSASNSSAVETAINAARERGVVVVVSAGNCHQGGSNCGGIPNRTSYPAALPGVIAVAATDRNDGHASYSNVNDYVDVAAPGGDGSQAPTLIWSTYPSNYGYDQYAGLRGTSMAAPYVAGLAALVMGEAPHFSPAQVACVIQSTADDLGSPGHDWTFGHGRVNVRRALERTWYGGEQCVAPTAQAEAVASLPAPRALDCAIPHAPDRLLVRADKATESILAQGFAGSEVRLHGELPGWQVWAVPEGQACALLQRVNQAGGSPFAELDPLATVPVGEWDR